MSPTSSLPVLVPGPVARELDDDEPILWMDGPDPAWMRRKLLPLLFVSLPIGGFLLVWMWGASEGARAVLALGQAPDIFSLALPVFGLLGLGLSAFVSWMPWAEGARARRTFYVLTNRRALIVIADKNKTVKSVLPCEFSLERHDFAAWGDIVLRRELLVSGDSERTIEVSFEGIRDAHEVEKMMRDLKLSVCSGTL